MTYSCARSRRSSCLPCHYDFALAIDTFERLTIPWTR
jgi:hypothetical protein